MRYAILLVLGLAIGIIGTVMAMNALHNRPDHPRSLMEVIDLHGDALDANVKANRCAGTDNLPHLQTMRALANDIEPVFLPIDNEADFRQKASNLRATLDAALASPPSNCALVGAVLARLGHDCKACHSQFRH